MPTVWMCRRKEEEITVEVEYALEINNEHLADCHIRILAIRKSNRNIQTCQINSVSNEYARKQTKMNEKIVKYCEKMLSCGIM